MQLNELTGAIENQKKSNKEAGQRCSRVTMLLCDRLKQQIEQLTSSVDSQDLMQRWSKTSGRTGLKTVHHASPLKSRQSDHKQFVRSNELFQDV